MKRIFITGHSCQPNVVIQDRYWLVEEKTFKHLGVFHAVEDFKFFGNLIRELGAEIYHMGIPDEAFKTLLQTLGYEQVN